MPWSLGLSILFGNYRESERQFAGIGCHVVREGRGRWGVVGNTLFLSDRSLAEDNTALMSLLCRKVFADIKFPE